MIIDKQREGRSDHISLSPELDQARDPPLGGKVGVPEAGVFPSMILMREYLV